MADYAGAGTGAAAGADIGASIGGGWGALIGGVLGGFGGALGGGDAKKAERAQKRLIREQYWAQQRMSGYAYAATLGKQRTGYAAAGVDATRGTAAILMQETQQQYAENARAIAQAAKYSLLGAGSSTGWWGAASGLARAGAEVYSSFAKKKGP
jgi:hypothetical protein